MRKRVGVVGGGIAGASAAYHLLKADRSLEIILVEAEDQLGFTPQDVQLLCCLKMMERNQLEALFKQVLIFF